MDALTVQALLAQGVSQLRQAGRGDCAPLEAQLLLAHALDRLRSHLLVHAEDKPNAAALARYLSLIDRAARGEPLAYLTGQQEFWSLTLSVTPDVLIPRPESELAVERCLALLAQPVSRICDLGTGSGAIALALASERPSWRITATDVSAAALNVARGNAARLGIDGIEFLQGDWFAPLAGRAFDLIVSNPPYVSARDPALSALRYEPALALTPGVGGLEALHWLIAASRIHLEAGGWLVLEHGADQGAPVAAALVEAGYARVGCHRDLAGHDRISEGQRP